MTLTSAQLAAWLGQFLWPLLRIGAALSVMPVLGSRMLPRRVRAATALVLSALCAGLAPPMPALEPLSPAGLLTAVQQVLIGLFMGYALRVAFSALETGGQVIALQMGLSFASLVDPQNGAQQPLLGSFYNLLGMLIFLGLDGHLILLRMLVESFHTLPVAPDALSREMLRTLPAFGARIFAGAVLVALPAMASLTVVNLAFGVMSRAAPQLNIFAVGLPVTLLLGLAILLYSLPALLPQFRLLLEDAFALAGALAGVAAGEGG
ncbi:flagellar biosynthetic protein FliR [Plasticicumulans lactativorans]|uniref:Flagellar biosynthetic protein FliR n=1 Tax=Plasticicumulans lactativorans TaxID=1133106 RepID=A0A4R2LA79_9GAMM|nr:flagellar biosynthetic protein FliR [Plasticicumulans lactativorans]TCO79678.1 flagellar biosynthetic protein FliR [Plasticicumulans lactativorans]